MQVAPFDVVADQVSQNFKKVSVWIRYVHFVGMLVINKERLVC